MPLCDRYVSPSGYFYHQLLSFCISFFTQLLTRTCHTTIEILICWAFLFPSLLRTRLLSRRRYFTKVKPARHVYITASLSIKLSWIRVVANLSRISSVTAKPFVLRAQLRFLLIILLSILLFSLFFSSSLSFSLSLSYISFSSFSSFCWRKRLICLAFISRENERKGFTGRTFSINIYHSARFLLLRSRNSFNRKATVQFSDPLLFDRLLMQNDGLSLIEPRTVLDASTMAGLSDTLPVVKKKTKEKNRGKVQKKERKKERNILQLSNNEMSSFGKRRRKLRHRHNFYTLPQHSNTLLYRAIVSILRFFETRPSLVSRLENPIIQTRRACSSKLVETDPVFVADGHEVCRVVLLRELCKCRT